MTVLRLLPPAIALLLLAAHFWRAQWWPLAIACVVLVGVLALRRPWAARLVQTALMLGSIEWLRTLAALVATRMAMGQPYARMTLILGAVAVATLAAALVFRARALRERYNLARCTDTAGKRWVAKAKEPEETTAERLKNFAVLYPPFLYPQPASQPYDPYLLYPYIEGTVLADGPFEEGEIIDQVVEIIGRVQALMRSLNLAPHYQQTLRSREPGQEGLTDSRFSLGWLQAMNDQQKRGRHREIAESFQWTEARLQEWCGAVQSRGVWTKAPLAAYREQIQKNFSMHVPVVGTNLCHTAIQPEHLLQCPGGQMGVLGWHIEPRPRFYMVYTYLVWSLLHSRRADRKKYYQAVLAKNSNTSFYEEHHRVFALCLLEQVARSCREQATGGFQPSEQRLEEAEQLFRECVENLAKKEKEAAEFMQT